MTDGEAQALLSKLVSQLPDCVGCGRPATGRDWEGHCWCDDCARGIDGDRFDYADTINEYWEKVQTE